MLYYLHHTQEYNVEPQGNVYSLDIMCSFCFGTYSNNKTKHTHKKTKKQKNKTIPLPFLPSLILPFKLFIL